MKKTFALLFLKIGSAALTYISNALVTRSVSTKDAGYYFLFTTIITIFSGISKLGLDIQSIKKVSVYSTHQKRNELEDYVNNTLLLLILFDLIIALPVISVTYFTIDNKTAIYFVGFALIFYSIKDVIAAMLRGIQQYYQAGFILNSSLPLLLTILLGLNFIFHQKLNIYLIYSISCFFSFFCGILFLLKNKIFKFSFKKDIKIASLTKVINVNKYMITLFLMAINWLPNILVGFFLNVESVAVFNVINRTAVLISFIYIAAENYVSPKIASHFSQGNHRELELLLIKMSKVSFIVSTLVIIGTIAGSKYIMGFFGKNYVPYSSLFVLLAIAQYVNVLTGNAATFMIMTNREKVVKYIYLFTVVAIIILIPLTSSFGNLYYVTISYALVIMLYNIALTVIAKLRYQTRVTFMVP